MTWFDISVVKRVELGPEHLTFELQRVDHRLLLLAIAGMVEAVGQSEIGVSLGLNRTLVEIGQRLLRDEVVMGEHALGANADDIRREELGQRRGDRLQKRALANEMHIGVDGKARSRQNTASGHDIVAIEPDAVGQGDPFLDPTAFALGAVMVDDALAPFTPQLDRAKAGENEAVLHRDHRLVVIAIERPGLNLLAGQTPFLKQDLEGMARVITLLANGSERGLQGLPRHHLAHGSISIPS